MKSRIRCALIKTVAVFLAVIFAYPVFSSGSVSDGGRCGDDLYWRYSGNVLTISGTGDMYNFVQRTPYNRPGEMPWRSYNASISRVVIEEGCTCVGEYAFHSFAAINEIRFPETLKEIKSYAFARCAALRDVSLPDSLEKLGSGVFSECEALVSATFGNGLKTVAAATFDGDSALTSVTMSDSVKEIGNRAFGGCSSLSTFDFSRVEKIDPIAFINCSSLAEASFGADLGYMCTYAFSGCSSLSQVTFHEDTDPVYVDNTFLADTAYYRTLPDGTYTMFGGRVLMCKGSYTKTSLKVPDGVEIIAGYAFDASPYLNKVTLPDSLTTVCDCAFRDCKKLYGVYVPPSVRYLGTNCLGIYTKDLGNYVGLDGFSLSGKGLGAAYEYAVGHCFLYECVHESAEEFIEGNCTDGGVTRTYCTLCGACLDVNIVSARPHSFEETYVPASCDAPGLILRRCTGCGYEETEEVAPARGHTPYGAWTVISLPTCSGRGCAARYCSVCGGYAETVELEKRDHVPAASYATEKEPTCFEEGTETLRCRMCGGVIDERVLPKREHEPADERVTLTLPSEDGTLCGCSVLLCRYCSSVLDVIWLDTDGAPQPVNNAARTLKDAMTELICCAAGKTELRSLDFTRDGGFDVKDIRAFRKISGNTGDTP